MKRKAKKSTGPVAVFTGHEVLRMLMQQYPERFAVAGFAAEGTADMYLDTDTGVLRIVQTKAGG